jgi:hypothetical protein
MSSGVTGRLVWRDQNRLNVIDYIGHYRVHHVFTGPSADGHDLHDQCRCDPRLVYLGRYVEAWGHLGLP